jgi:hypothetical protein
VWPWDDARTGRVLAEAFPAAQLKTWDLPWYGYNGDAPSARRRRRAIVKGIAARTDLVIPAAFERLMVASADALDSVICALAARALSTDALAERPGDAGAAEGWIVVHR